MTRPGFPFSTRFRVRYSEIDGQKIVFNSRYLEYADIVMGDFWRWAEMADLGPDWMGAQFNFVRATIDYKKPFRLGDTVEGRAWIERVGNSSLTSRIDLHGADTGDLHTSIETVSVHVDLAAGKSMPLPASVRERLEMLVRD